VLELNAPLSWEAALFRGLPASSRLLKRESLVLTKADLLVCVSQELRAYAIRRGVREERILVQANGAERATGSVSSSWEPQEAGASREQAFVLGYAGSFKAWQGLPEAIPRLCALRSEVAPRSLHLDLWGDGPEREQFLEAVQGHEGISLTWHGWGEAEVLQAARCHWDAAWVPLAPWPPRASSDGRTIAALEDGFGERVPGMYFSPLKEAEAIEAGLPIWPSREHLEAPTPPMTWEQIAANILEASGFATPASREKIRGEQSAARQANV